MPPTRASRMLRVASGEAAATRATDFRVPAENVSRPSVTARLHRPFVVGLVGTLGGLGAILVALVLSSLSTVLVYVGAALFIALGLDPVVRWLRSKGIKRGWGVMIVFAAFTAIVVAVLWLVLPIVVTQLVQLGEKAPQYLTDIGHQQWFLDLNRAVGGAIDIQAITAWVQDFVTKPENWVKFTGGLLQFGIGIVNGLLGAMIVLILTLYFLASLPTMKQGLYALVPQRNREGFADISEQIAHSIGGYVNGMVILAVINAGLGFIVMTIMGVPFAGVVAVIIFLFALIPLVGSVVATIVASAAALFASPVAALVVLAYYLVYMQVEAYVLTPRIMNRTISVPGSLVVIGALAGGTLLGILGALVAIPVAASILLIIKQVVIPRQNRQV